jgi:hypothetical protein
MRIEVAEKGIAVVKPFAQESDASDVLNSI